MAPCLSEMQRVEGKFSGFQAQKGWTNILRWSALRFLRHDIAQTDKQTNKQTRWCLRLWNPKLGRHDETRWPRACSWPDTTQSSNLGFPMLHLSFIFFTLTRNTHTHTHRSSFVSMQFSFYWRKCACVCVWVREKLHLSLSLSLSLSLHLHLHLHLQLSLHLCTVCLSLSLSLSFPPSAPPDR